MVALLLLEPCVLPRHLLKLAGELAVVGAALFELGGGGGGGSALFELGGVGGGGSALFELDHLLHLTERLGPGQSHPLQLAHHFALIFFLSSQGGQQVLRGTKGWHLCRSRRASRRASRRNSLCVSRHAWVRGCICASLSASHCARRAAKVSLSLGRARLVGVSWLELDPLFGPTVL